MPEMGAALAAAWHALMDLHARLPEGTWTLIGGQMVHVHCAERGTYPRRATDDADALLDVKALPTILYDFTKGLKDLDFSAAGVTPEGHQHRWKKGEAQIDVLIGSNLGERADRRTGVDGGTTLGTPGSAHVLKRSEDIQVKVSGRTGMIRRPTLIGSLIAKAAAHSVPNDTLKGRHRDDFAVLAALVTNQDLRNADLSKSERKYLAQMIDAVRADARSLEIVPEAGSALDRLEQIARPIKS